MVEVKTEKKQRKKHREKTKKPKSITEYKSTHPLLGLDWVDKLEIGLQVNKNTNII